MDVDDAILKRHRSEEAILWWTTARRFLEAAKAEGSTLGQAEHRAIRRVWALVGHGITEAEAERIETHIYVLADEQR